MITVGFPKMFNTSATKVVNDKNNYKAINQSIKCIILSNKVKEVDVQYGVNLQSFFYEQNNGVLMDVLRETIFEKLVLFLGKVIYIKRNWITFEREMGKLKINIKYQIKSDYTKSELSLVLFDDNETMRG